MKARLARAVFWLFTAAGAAIIFAAIEGARLEVTDIAIAALLVLVGAFAQGMLNYDAQPCTGALTFRLTDDGPDVYVHCERNENHHGPHGLSWRDQEKEIEWLTR